MYCHNCGSIVGQNARFCESCGKPQSVQSQPDAAMMQISAIAAVPERSDECSACEFTNSPDTQICINCGAILAPGKDTRPVSSAGKAQRVAKTKPMSYTWPVVIIALTAGIILIGSLDGPKGGLTDNRSSLPTAGPPEANRDQFENMSPAEHLLQARTSSTPNASAAVIAEGLRHLRAIPQSAPEAAQAKRLEKRLTRAHHLATAQEIIDSVSTEDMRATAWALGTARDEIQAVLKENPHDKDALRLLELATKKGEESLTGSRQARTVLAQEMMQRANSSGFEMNIWVSATGDGRELNVDSEMFKDTATRVQFVNGVLPEWKSDLCKAGFREVKLRQGGTFDLGRDYSLNCKP